MSFFYEYEKYNAIDITGEIQSTEIGAVYRALDKNRLSIEDFAALISPAALPCLEDMALKARDIKQRHFGNTIHLFTPIYLSNYCTNQCLYCGFNRDVDVPRHKMTLDEVRIEAEAIAKTGLKHILVLTGDAPVKSSVEYIGQCCRILKAYFSAISIEVYALTQEEYEILIDAGVDGLTIYQETYNEPLYSKLHPSGPKRSYRFRLDAPERGARAGMRNINIGGLLGLDPWHREIFLRHFIFIGWSATFPRLISVSPSQNAPPWRPL